MFKIGKCGEQGGNEGQDDRRVTKDGVCGVAKAARESFDISTRIPTRDVCVELARPTTSVNVFPAFPVLPLFLREITDASNGKMKYFLQTAEFPVVSTPRKCEKRG